MTEIQNPTLALPEPDITAKDYKFAIAAGLLIGILALPVLKAANPGLYDKFWLVVIPFFFFATPLGLRVAFFIGKKLPIIRQVAKFGVSGVLNTMVDTGILMSLSFLFSKMLGISADKTLLFGVSFYSLYKAASFILANVNSYYWNKYWTFNQQNEEKKSAEFFQFFIVSIIGFLINVVVASSVFAILMFGSSDQKQLLGAVAGAAIGLIWNFIGYKFWVFKK